MSFKAWFNNQAFLFGKTIKGEVNMNEIFETKDFYLACFLKAKGIKLLNASGDKIRDIVFSFQKVENFEGIINNFYNENELIPAIKIVREYKLPAGYSI